MSEKVKIAILAQADPFFIPHNIALLHDRFEIAAIIQINCKQALAGTAMKKKFLHWFGFFQCGKMGLVVIWRKIRDLLDPLANWRILRGEGSLRHIAQRFRIPFREVTNINAPEVVEYLKGLNLDVICSFSAPQVIKEPLLSMPKYGNINVHGSLLPDFRGIMPSFWTVYKHAPKLGATVHYMSEKIDDGKIILQDSVDANNIHSMFQAMQITKKIGGIIMKEALIQIEERRVVLKDNDPSQGNYCTWPTDEEVADFRHQGFRFI